MDQQKNSFERGIEELKGSAGRITHGLEDVIAAIENVAAENRLFLNESHEDAQPNKTGDPIAQLLSTIHTQVSDIVNIGHAFEKRITAYGKEIIHLNRQLEKTKLEAMVDPTTGIGNRRKFEEALKLFLGKISEFNNQISVLLADIDNFKSINDTLGHHVGDQVLRLVAENFARNLKGSDIIARWGGDEFAAILPNTTNANAMHVADNVRGGLEQRTIRNKETGEELGKVTLSIGVSSFRAGDNPHKMIFRADQSMYNAKRKGKNRVVSDSDIP
ncbi:GGDEF domain-containing protein [Varunaivibrio sulfuroxidans]|uniref:diguanylate cyclase n=1 Tax=Varunaivibrio sulfuroxidans TaxID=1773489 RepID=A0A4R3JD66_9PROT|nr:GGDEF domain-containing protein [Varunaivibrio sulfuroxidans]TCS63136.1 diguanylate cyclase [Varunaivibrio sulfuroxidans]WES31797.1 GGDEF domain-containing protein [Varunaivibrio sulfuroxidans]